MSNERNSRVQEFGYRAPRFPADFQLLLQIGDPEPRVLEARCTDISADGVAVRMPERLSVGTEVTLVLTLPGSSTSLRVAGRVIYQKNDEHGLTFVFSSPQERDSVGKHLSSVTLRTLGSRRPPG